MKETLMTKSILNWCYGASEPIEGLETTNEQLSLAHRYKNKLVELEIRRRQQAEDLAAQMHPEFLAARDDYEAAEALLEAAFTSVKASRIKARKRVEPTDAHKGEIDLAKQLCRQAYARLKEHKKTAYLAASEAKKPFRAKAESELSVVEGESETARKRRLNNLYLQMLSDAKLSGGEWEFERDSKHARATCGLYWGTYLFVEDAAKEFREGPPPKFKRFTGHGSIAVQIQGGLSYEKATSCTDKRLRLELPAMTERMATTGNDHGRQAIGKAWIRIGSDNSRNPIWCVVPFVYHRELPKDAIIKWAFIDRRPVGMHYEWKLRLTIQTDRNRATPETEMAAVHLGYRSVERGLRVATVITEHGDISELVLPASELKEAEYQSGLGAIRENIANAVMDDLKSWIQTLEPSEESNQWFLEHTKTIGLWRGPERLHQLVVDWRFARFPSDSANAHDTIPNIVHWAEKKLQEYQQKPHYRPRIPDDLTTVFGVLEFWRKFDKHLCEWAANISRKRTLRRENLYRTFAKELAAKHSRIVLAKIDWKKLRLTPEVNEEEVVGTGVRRAAAVAAPGRLSEILNEAFAGRVIHVSPDGISQICNDCGADHEYDRKQIVTTCGNCRQSWDQDHNAARNTLARGQVSVLSKSKNTGKTGSNEDAAKTPRKRRPNRRSDQQLVE